MALDLGGEALNKIFEWGKKLNTHTAAGKASANSSLARFANILRVEPICVVDSDCIRLEYIGDIISSMQAVFTSYYLQAVSLLGEVSGVSVAKELDKLNPNRDPKTAQWILSTAANAAGSYLMSKESYTHRLPNRQIYSQEAEGTKGEGLSLPKDTSKTLTALMNLSTGYVYDVTITKNGQSATVPIAIRLLVNELRPDLVAKMFGKGDLDKSFTERWYKYKAGRISFWKDLVFCQDLIREEKKAQMYDKEGVLSEIQNRANKNIQAGLISGQTSLATSSNIYVISTTTADMIRRATGLDINSYEQRQKLMGQTYTMLMAVVDRDYERINFFYDGIRLPTSAGAKDIKRKGSNEQPNMMEMLKAYTQGMAPTL